VPRTTDNPWPGPAPYQEADDRVFFGRVNEITYLESSIERSILTVLYGTSGVGKTSILRAGIVPALRKTGRYLPLYLRPSHVQQRSPVEVVRSCLNDEASRFKFDVNTPESAGTLWEFFQDRDFEIWNTANQPVTPVLIVDQFEELLAITDQDSENTKWRAVFFRQFCDLVENRIPHELSRKFDEEKMLGRQFNYDRICCRIVISFKEESLPKIRRLRRYLPSVIENHYRVEDLTITAAIDAIEKPADFFSHDDAVELADELSQPSGLIRLLNEIDSDSPNDEERLVHAAALSLICFLEYAEKSKQGHRRQGSVDVDGLLDDHYDRVSRSIDRRLRTVVESTLVTKSGERIDIPKSTILDKSHASDSDIARLTDGGVVRIERVGSEDRISVSHDLLAKAIARAGKARAKRRKLNLTIAGSAVCLVAAISFVGYKLYADRTAADKDLRALGQFVFFALSGPDQPENVKAAVKDKILGANSETELRQSYEEVRRLVYMQNAMIGLSPNRPHAQRADQDANIAGASVDTPYCNRPGSLPDSQHAAFNAEQVALLQFLVLPAAVNASRISEKGPWFDAVAFDLASLCEGSAFYASWNKLLKEDWAANCKKAATRCGQPIPTESPSK
jgi:hypothetical protein